MHESEYALQNGLFVFFIVCPSSWSDFLLSLPKVMLVWVLGKNYGADFFRGCPRNLGQKIYRELNWRGFKGSCEVLITPGRFH